MQFAMQIRQQFRSVSHVHSWAEGGSTLLYFDTAAPAPPAGKTRDHRIAGPELRGSPPQRRHAGGTRRFPAWGSLVRTHRVTEVLPKCNKTGVNLSLKH